MKKVNRFATILLALAMVCTTAFPALAEESEPAVQTLSETGTLLQDDEDLAADIDAAQEQVPEEGTDALAPAETAEEAPEKEASRETADELAPEDAGEGTPGETVPEDEFDGSDSEGNEAMMSDAGITIYDVDFAQEDDADDESSEDLSDEEELETLPVTDGFGEGDDGAWYYYSDGQIETGKNSVIKGTVKGEEAWWYVVGGKVQFSFTGLADYSNSNGWWYIENGKVTFTKNTVAQNKNGWFYVEDSKVNFGYTGFAQNSNGWWYIENGAVNFGKNSVIQDTHKKINGSTDWWYVVGGQVQTAFTGLADYSNSNGWWYIKDGKVDFTHNGVDQNKNGWWYVLEGKVQFGFTGLANYSNSNGWWYIKNGKVDFTHNGVDQNKNGWWYVLNGKVQFSFTGLADYSNANGWWYINNGKVDFTKNTVAQNTNGWWYVTDGKVNFSYTGVANYSNANGWWYIKKGAVDFSFNGIASNSNGSWYVRNGKVDFSYSGSYVANGITYTISNGKVTRSSISMVESSTVTGSLLSTLTASKGLLLSRTLSQDEFNQIISEFMKSSYINDVTYNLITDNFIWNSGPRWDCSSTTLYLVNYYLLTYDEAYQAAKKADPSASASELAATALASVGKKASSAYPEYGTLYPVNAATQATSWGNSVYTYSNISQLTASNPCNLRYGDLLFYGNISGNSVTITHVAVYLGQYYLSDGDMGYYQLENTNYDFGGIKEGRADGVRISPFRTDGVSTTLVHAARIF